MKQCGSCGALGEPGTVCLECGGRGIHSSGWEPDSHWDDHPKYPVADWQCEVSEGNTRQSYIEWVNSHE